MFSSSGQYFPLIYQKTSFVFFCSTCFLFLRWELLQLIKNIFKTNLQTVTLVAWYLTSSSSESQLNPKKEFCKKNKFSKKHVIDFREPTQPAEKLLQICKELISYLKVDYSLLSCLLCSSLFPKVNTSYFTQETILFSSNSSYVSNN